MQNPDPVPDFLDRAKAKVVESAVKKVEGRPEHSLMGASSAHRWFICAGSVGLSKGLSNPDSNYSLEGNAAHKLGATCLEDGSDAWEHVGETIIVPREMEKPYLHVVDQEMVENLQVYLDTVRGDRELEVGDEASPLWIEKRFCLSDIDENLYGTTDAGFVKWTGGNGTGLVTYRKGLLRIYDLKYGVGIVVEVEWNEQAMIYGCGALAELYAEDPAANIEEVELVIVQPRAEHEEGPVRRWRISVDELGTWASGKLTERVAQVRSPNPPLVSGDHCRFCPAKGVCPLIRANYDEFSEQSPRAVTELEDWELVERAGKVQAVRKFIGYVEDELFSRLVKGRCTGAGFKIVRKKSNRVWKDDAEPKAVALFGDSAYAPPKLRSPSQMDKLEEGKSFTKEMAFKPDTGLTLAGESDRRGAVSARTAREALGSLVEDNLNNGD